MNEIIRENDIAPPDGWLFALELLYQSYVRDAAENGLPTSSLTFDIGGYLGESGAENSNIRYAIYYPGMLNIAIALQDTIHKSFFFFFWKLECLLVDD